MPSFKERVDRHDHEIGAIRKLLLMGAKTLVKHDQHILRMEGLQADLKQEHAAARKEMRELRASQRETDRLLQGLIRSMRGGNGHSKTRIE
jgi:hypothetical protein